MKNKLVKIKTPISRYHVLLDVNPPKICVHPTKDRRYVQILQQCQSFKTLHEIYPNTRSPIMHQLYALEHYGYIARYISEKSFNETFIPKGTIRNSLWKTTPKGKRLLKSLGLI